MSIAAKRKRENNKPTSESISHEKLDRIVKVTDKTSGYSSSEDFEQEETHSRCRETGRSEKLSLKKRRVADSIKPKHGDKHQRTQQIPEDGAGIATQSVVTAGKLATGRDPISWRKVTAEDLNLDYCCQFYSRSDAASLLRQIECEVEWNSAEESKVQIFGRWHEIPRKQAAFGDEGLTYKFSGKTVRAKPWIPILLEIRDRVQSSTGYKFNFVLVNRYKDGSDHIGEHRDDEKELVEKSPIASLSLGQTRDFVFRHRDARGKHATRKLEAVRLSLSSGSLLMMKYPTNTFWYHSLPARKKALGLRINLTFRDFVVT